MSTRPWQCPRSSRKYASTPTPSSLILITKQKSASFSPHQPSRRLPPRSCKNNKKMSPNYFLISSWYALAPAPSSLILSSWKHSTIPASIITHPNEKHKTCFVKSTSTISPTISPSHRLPAKSCTTTTTNEFKKNFPHLLMKIITIACCVLIWPIIHGSKQCACRVTTMIVTMSTHVIGGRLRHHCV